MKTYLVPTDYSDNARNALDYALAVASKVKRKIVLLSVYNIPSSSVGMLMSLKRKLLEGAEDGMVALLKEIQEEYAAKGVALPEIETVVVEGNPVDTILEAVDNFKVSAIFMGTQGASGLEGRLLGSNTSKVIERANIPVLAIPENAKFNGFGTVVYATETLASDDKSFLKLLEQLEAFDVKYEVLHVQSSSEPNGAAIEEKAKAFEAAMNMDNLSVSIRKNDDVQMAIADFVKESQAGLLAMVTEQRGFLRRVFDPSLTRKMVLQAETALMVFHKKKKKLLHKG